MDAIKYRIAEKALNLTTQVDWASRYVCRLVYCVKFTHPSAFANASARAGAEASLTAISGLKQPWNPSAPPPSTTLVNLAGNYSNAGYGEFELCVASTPFPPAPSPACESLLGDLDTTLPGVVNGSVPTLVARFDQIGITHIYFEHVTNDTFNAFVIHATPPGGEAYGGTNGVPVTAQFVVEKKMVAGIGFVGGIWGAGDVSEPEGGTVEERAEVWFDRV